MYAGCLFMRMLAVLMLGCFVQAVNANDRTSNVLTDLQVAVAQSSYRVVQIKECVRMNPRLFEQLSTQYEDARAVHNAALEGWARLIKIGKYDPAASEPERVAQGLQQVRRFIETADNSMSAIRCNRASKAGAGKAIVWLLPLVPDIVDAVSSFVRSNRSDAERAEMLRELALLRMESWKNIPMISARVEPPANWDRQKSGS